MSLYTLTVVPSVNGHQIALEIDHQTFYFEEQQDEVGMSSEESCSWYMNQISIALDRLMKNAIREDHESRRASIKPTQS